MAITTQQKIKYVQRCIEFYPLKRTHAAIVTCIANSKLSDMSKDKAILERLETNKLNALYAYYVTTANYLSPKHKKEG